MKLSLDDSLKEIIYFILYEAQPSCLAVAVARCLFLLVGQLFAGRMAMHSWICKWFSWYEPCSTFNVFYLGFFRNGLKYNQ